MSNYPDDIRQYDNDPRSPFYNGREPEDIDVWDHPEFINRLDDINGYFIEAFTEAPDEWLKNLSGYIQGQKADKVLEMITNRLEEYCGQDLPDPPEPEPDFDTYAERDW